MEQYKHTHRGNPRIHDIVTLDDDGSATIVFHGTDRTVTHTDARLVDTPYGKSLSYGNGGCLLPMLGKDGTLTEGWTRL